MPSITRRSTRRVAMANVRIIGLVAVGSLCLISSSLAQEKNNLRPLPNAAVNAQKAAAPQFDYTLILGENQFDLAQGDVAIPPGWQPQASPREDGKDFHLVQFTGPVQSRWLDQLHAAGAEVIQYLHPFTYIVWATQADRDNLFANVEAVRATGAFAPSYKVLPQWRNLPDQEVAVNLVVLQAAGVEDVLAQIQQVAPTARITGHAPTPFTPFEHVTATMSGAAFQAIAAIPGVYTIQTEATDGGLRGEMTNQMNVGNYNASNQCFPGYMTWLTSVGLNGNGVKIANVDGGVQDSHPNLVNRMAPCVGSSCGGATSSSHGTHTAGIMAADNSSGVLDSFGFARGMGVAPGAKIVEQLYSPTYTQPNGMYILMTQSFANGALLSGNSWGPSGSPLGYDDKTKQTDVGVRDTDPATPGDQPLTFVLSIMNGNGGTSTQGTPDEAKNLFTIGSTKGQNTNGSQILQIDDISANSAHGPCLDGRKIPHAVAPGCQVDSTYTTSTYSLLCGTSMASPHVSGAVAVFIEYYRNITRGRGVALDPSPALVKAAFLPVCYDLAGHMDADNGVLGHPFDSKQGWGRMNLAAVVNPPANSVRYFDQEVIFDNTGEQWTASLAPLDSTKPMKIMLVWTDAPGHGLGGSTPAWNNNLDLVVEGGFGAYKGNVFGPSGFSITGGVADDRNNTEGVFIPAGGGAVTVRVIASNITSNGCPNSGDTTDQDFALVVYNAALEPGFALSATPSSHNVCAPTSVSFTVDVASIMGYTDPVTLSAALPSGVTGGFTPNPVVPGNTSTLNLTVAGNTPAGSHPFQIVGDAGALQRTVNVSLDVANAIPMAVTLTSPANGAMNVSLSPTMTWNMAPQAASYELQVATDNSFGSVVYSATISGGGSTSHTLANSLATDTIHYWRMRALNTCGIGPYSSTFSFRTLDVPPILLVDDDRSTTDYRSYYTAALNSLGVNYDIFDTGATANAEPTAAQLAGYEIIIWFSGVTWNGTSSPQAGPTAATDTVLQAWLDNGGCYFLSAQDYLYDRIGSGNTTPNAFMQNYLGMGSPIAHDISQTSVTGQNVFAGLGPYSLTYPFTNYSDRVPAGANGQLAFNGNQQGAGVTRDGGNYRAIFFGFPFEAIPTPADRATVMNTILSWCGQLNIPCPGDITGDDVVNVSDLLAVINAWGPCQPPPNTCPADTNGDGSVNVTDLLAVINAWGACP